MTEDESHLNALSVGHYACGALLALFGCLPLIHMGMGLFIVFGNGAFFPDLEDGQEFPRAFGWFFVFLGFCFFLMAQAMAVGVIMSGRFLKRRKNYMFSFVMACVACLSVPIGTILGVFTIIVLSRDSVKRIYGKF